MLPSPATWSSSCALFDGETLGSAYVFARNHGGPNNWGEVMKLTGDAAEDNYLGASVGISGLMAISGAPWHDNHGAAYLYRVPEPSSGVLVIVGLLSLLINTSRGRSYPA